ncbi:30S ribosomal protein S4e [Candidatus Micrarchaeota archaeon]|nr:30S ribosomal protein S4e [Candidatus Micrarchaeota archaeon]
MAKRGRKGHTKRIAVPKAVPIHDKKARGRVWIANTNPGTHPARKSMPLVALLREVLGVAENAKEVKIILGDRKVLVDGVPRTDHRFPIGYMDIISMPAADEYYRIGVNRGKLVLEKVEKDATGVKFLKVTGKKTVKGNKVSLSLHDGRNLLADNGVSVGDTIEFDLGGKKIGKLHKLGKGAKCMITDGKHSGASVVVEEIYPSIEGRSAEALVAPAGGKGGTFRTLAGYLFVMGE